MPRRMLIRHLKIVGIAVMFAGCAAGDAIVDPSDGTRGMIFGRFDYSDSKHIVTHMTLDPRDRVSVRAGMRGERVHVYRGGVFFFEDLKPGKYGVSALFSGDVMFTLPSGQKMEVAVGPGEIRYIGTYKLKIDDLKLFRRTGGAITRTDRNPNELEALGQVYELVKDTGWRPKIERRIAQLMRSW